MSLATTLSSLESQLTRFFPHYVEVDRVELLPFATPGDVVAALRSSSSLKASERYALVAALVAEHQQRPHPLWTSILVLGFAPMMLRMRRGLGRVRDDDHDQRVVFAFLRALGEIKPVGSFVAVALRRATKKALIADTEPKWETVPFDEEDHTPYDPFAPTEAELRIDAAWEARRARRIAAEQTEARRRVRKLPRKGRVAA